MFLFSYVGLRSDRSRIHIWVSEVIEESRMSAVTALKRAAQFWSELRVATPATNECDVRRFAFAAIRDVL